MKNNRLGMTDILLNDKEIKINFHELIKAIDINNKNIFEKLLKNADDKLKNEKNKKNETLLKYAINLNNPGMVDVLLKDKKIKVTMNELIEATFPGKEQFLEPLLEKIDEKEKNENDRFTYNLLSNTIHYGNSNALKILLKNEKIKKEINQIHGNKSLLDLAESKAEGKNSEIINLLRSNGAVETPKK
ncbi:MAG: hypothetical protein FWC41_08425, partial [Firmicutes bacterium]|nr:hypothetical protein [Bacillota bacterium]